MPCEEERPVLAWLQLSLVQFLIANCLEIFGEDVPSPLGESSGMVVPVRLQNLLASQPVTVTVIHKWRN
ncbi:T-Cell Activation Rho Gtpase-Activating Protein [Manis pentadactyla]|nr:T-Cell Activation Rho Gtpase-Activating Protein [Manis pentadactyla]